jgi:hypothetical protein
MALGGSGQTSREVPDDHSAIESEDIERKGNKSAETGSTQPGIFIHQYLSMPSIETDLFDFDVLFRMSLLFLSALECGKNSTKALSTAIEF